MVDGLDIKFALTYFNEVRFRDRVQLPLELKELRAQSIAEVPWLSVPAREQLLNRVKRHAPRVDQIHQTKMLMKSIDEMPDKKHVKHGRTINPHDFVTGAEILLDRYPESTHWRPMDIVGAVAGWWGITYGAMIRHIHRPEFFFAVRELNHQIAMRIESIHSRKRWHRIMPDEFVTFGREALTELQGSAISTKKILTFIGNKRGYANPYHSTFLYWNMPKFKEEVRAIDKELVEFIEGIRQMDALSMERFIQYAEMALDQGMVHAWSMLWFIGTKAGYGSGARGSTYNRYRHLHDKIQVVEPGLIAIMDQELLRNQRRAAWQARLDGVIARPELELCDDGELRTRSHSLWFRTMTSSVLTRFVSPPAFVNRHVSYGIIY
jgi:hypothetical protein